MGKGTLERHEIALFVEDGIHLLTRKYHYNGRDTTAKLKHFPEVQR